MIVMALIAILTGVLVPTMRSYIIRSRLNTANSNAKVIFNALQTVMLEYEFQERSAKTSLFYGDLPTGATKHTGTLFLEVVNGDVRNAQSSVLSTLSVDDVNYSATNTNTIGSRMRRLYPDWPAMSWNAYIEDYSVRAVYAAVDQGTSYIGCYPGAARERKFRGLENLRGADKDEMAAYAAMEWSVASVSTST